MTQVTFKHNPVTLVGTERKVGDKAPNFTVVNRDLEEVTLHDYDGKVRLISVVPSIDTSVCSTQTRKFNEEASNLDNTVVLTISVDLPLLKRNGVPQKVYQMRLHYLITAIFLLAKHTV